MNTKTNSFYTKENLLCAGLLVVCVALAAVYMYLVSVSVVHVVIRQETEQASVALNSEISQLENRYIAAQHRVSEAIAAQTGYQAVYAKVFIDRTPATLVLSQN